MRTRNLNHSTYQHQYHIVWGTKYRRKILKDYVKSELIKSISDVTKKYPTLFVLAINVDQDHVHIQIEIPPNISVSKAVQAIKIMSTIRIRKKFKFIRELYLENSIWSVGYFSSTLGLNESQIKKYINNQGKNDYSKQANFLSS